jgi:hypothetical protein
MKRWWVSWNEPLDQSQDCRPIKWPLPPEIPHWWCTGGAGDGSTASICAVVDAPCENAAKKLVARHWKPDSWRFCEEKERGWLPASDRFPVKKESA